MCRLYGIYTLSHFLCLLFVGECPEVCEAKQDNPRNDFFEVEEEEASENFGYSSFSQKLKMMGSKVSPVQKRKLPGWLKEPKILPYLSPPLTVLEDVYRINNKRRFFPKRNPCLAFLIVNNVASSATKFEKFKINAQQMVDFVPGCLKKGGEPEMHWVSIISWEFTESLCDMTRDKVIMKTPLSDPAEHYAQSISSYMYGARNLLE